jgi:hypothetical protein
MNTLSKVAKKYKCVPCEYTTHNITNYNKHAKTLKHFKKLNPDYEEDPTIYKCNICDKIYQHISGLSRHKKKCISAPIISNEAYTSILIEKIDLLTNKVIELEQKGFNNTTNNITNNTINNISLIVQLNTNCSNATPLEDFGNNIEVEEEQLNYLLSNGLEKGILYTLLENLNLLPKIQRPLWCADKKRRKFLIKEINEWVEDIGRENLKKVCDSIAFECRKKYFELNPNNIPIKNYTDKEKDRFIKNYKVLTDEINYNKIYDSIATNAVAIYSNNEK